MRVSCPGNTTSSLERKWWKNVRRATPARVVMLSMVVAAYPSRSNRSRAAIVIRSRAAGRVGRSSDAGVLPVLATGRTLANR